MSKLLEPAYSSPHYAIIRPGGGKGIILAAGPGTPAALSLPAAGYAPACIYQNQSGAIGSFVYVNTGTLTAATWTNIL